jgi:hypothetical protein
VLAVRRCPEQTHGPVADDVDRIDLVDVLGQVDRIRMVRGMQRERFRIVVDRIVGRAAKGHLNPG